MFLSQIKSLKILLLLKNEDEKLQIRRASTEKCYYPAQAPAWKILALNEQIIKLTFFCQITIINSYLNLNNIIVSYSSLLCNVIKNAGKLLQMSNLITS